jgi:dUTPase
MLRCLCILFLAGVVDEDYRGNLGVVLFNHSDKPFNVSRGDRIAQLICQQIYYPELKEEKVSIIQFYVFSLEISAEKFDSSHL